MSAFRIYYKDGAKMMAPVLNREEYMALRDSDENRRAEKHKMLQMNYSCLPNDNGGLKGAKQMSNTVGMDVDIPRNENEDENEYQTRLAAIPEKVLSKKAELGLLMLERSATKGYHLVFRRHPELSQEDNLRWASSVLGVEYDRGAKDITRVFFTPADKLLYLDDALFNTSPIPNIPQQAGPSQQPLELAPLGGDGGGPFLRAFDLCVQQAGLTLAAMNTEGSRHTNLMAVLSVGLPKLMSRQQLMEVVKERMPEFAKTDDCTALIKYFYENYTADKGFMSAQLREINAKAQKAEAAADAGDEEEQALTLVNADYNPPEMPKKIPRIVHLEINNYDPRYQESLALSSSVGRAALASHFRAEYINGKILTPSVMVGVIGNSGTGKDTCTQLFSNQMKLTIDETERLEWEKVRKNTEMREKLKNSKDVPAKYHPKIRIFEGASKTSLLELQTNLGENGMLVGVFSETDGFVGSSQAAWSNLSVMLRKGFSGEKHRQFYMSDASCNTSVALNISMLMEGTPKAMLERMFSDKNCENGLMQRFIPVLMPKTKRTFRPPRQNFLTEDERKERDALYVELYQKDLSLGDDTYLLETPKMNQAIGKWYDELEERYNDGDLTDAEADLSHRCGEFMLRTAIPLIALYGKETKEIIDYSVWVGRMAFYNMCYIFGHRVQQNLNESNKLLSGRNDNRKTAEPLLNSLPAIFTVKQIQELRINNGQSPDVKMLLSRYCKSGKLERIGKGVYQQLKKVT